MIPGTKVKALYTTPVEPVNEPSLNRTNPSIGGGGTREMGQGNPHNVLNKL